MNDEYKREETMRLAEPDSGNCPGRLGMIAKKPNCDPSALRREKSIVALTRKPSPTTPQD